MQNAVKKNREGKQERSSEWKTSPREKSRVMGEKGEEMKRRKKGQNACD